MPRPPRHDHGGSSQHGRRKPPQAATDEERRFLHGRLKSGGRLAVEMIDGTRNLGEIRDAVAAEYGPAPLEEIEEYFRLLESVEVVRFK